LAAGVWYHFVITCDGNTYVAYLNGNPVATHAVFNTGASPQQLALGNNPLTYPSEQLYGGIDEVAIYNFALDQLTVTNHYLARYSDQPAPTVTTPVVTSAHQLCFTLDHADGVRWRRWAHISMVQGRRHWRPDCRGNRFNSDNRPLTVERCGELPLRRYRFRQPYRRQPTRISRGHTDSNQRLRSQPDEWPRVAPCRLTAITMTSPAVLTTAQQSASPALASGTIGSSALHYGTTNGVATNYVTVGVVPDLLFGASVDFSVSYWVRGTINTNLPFLCDSTNGVDAIVARAGGYYFGPDTAGDGGWEVGLGSTGHEMTTSGANIINDGNWHNLIHVANRVGNMTTYLDGSQVDNHAISFITDSVDTTMRPTSARTEPAASRSHRIRRATSTTSECGSAHSHRWKSAALSRWRDHHVSFAPPVNPIVRAALQIVQVSPGQYQIVWPGGGTLQASGDVVGAYTNVPSGTSPYTIRFLPTRNCSIG